MRRPWLAALLNAWPMPLGVGYLYLRQWSRFVMSFLWLQIIGMTLVRIVFGVDVRNLFAFTVWIAVIVDGYLTAKRMNAPLQAPAASERLLEEPDEAGQTNHLSEDSAFMSSSEAPSEVKCPHCGAEVTLDDPFCPECGSGLRELGEPAAPPASATAEVAGQRPKWRRSKVVPVAVGCAGVPLFLICVAACGYAWLHIITAPPQDVSVSVSCPAIVSRGQDIIMEVAIQNTGTQPLLLHSIDIGDAYLAGVAVQEAEPAFSRSTHVAGGFRSYEFFQNLPPQQTVVFRFEGVAVQPGDFRSDMDICITTATNCLTHELRTVVEDATATPTRTPTTTATPSRTPTLTPTPTRTHVPRPHPRPLARRSQRPRLRLARWPQEL